MRATIYGQRSTDYGLRPRGFTLIELLIVVAIIAILAAIAVPNFLEAQTRAKVAEVRSEMATIATALEAYAVDYNRYPPADNSFSGPAERLNVVTTPIAYLTSVPTDSFVRKTGTYLGRDSAEDPSGARYLYTTANLTFAVGNSDPHAPSRFGWGLSSGGPDLDLEFPYYPFAINFIASESYLNYIYDPTNGAVSRGEIFRRGGAKNPVIPMIDNQ